MKELKKIHFGAATLVVIRLIGAGVVAAACAVLLRSAGKDSVGIFTLAKMVPSFIAILIMLSISSNFPYFINQPQWDSRKLWGLAISWVVLIGGFFAILWIIFADVIAHKLFHDLISVKTTRLLSFGIPLMLMQIFLRHLLQAMRKMRYYLVGQLNDMLFLGISGIVSAIWFGSPDSIAISVIIAMGLNVLIQTCLTVSVIKWPSISFKLIDVRKVVHLGLQGYIGGIASLANYRLDVMLIGFFADVSTVGIYAIISKIAEIGRYSTVALTEFWTPYAAQKNSQDARLISKILFIRSWIITFVIMVFIAVISPWLLIIFGGKGFVREGLFSLYLLIIGMIIQGGNGPLMAYNIASGNPIRNSIATSVALIITIAFDIIFIPIWKLNGAAFASMCAYSTCGLVLYYLFCRHKNGIIE